MAANVLYTKVIPNEEIVFRVTNPINRIYPRSTFEIKQDAEYCDFTAKVFVKMGPLANNENIKANLEDARQHMREEDQNLDLMEQ